MQSVRAALRFCCWHVKETNFVVKCKMLANDPFSLSNTVIYFAKKMYSNERNCDIHLNGQRHA